MSPHHLVFASVAVKFRPIRSGAGDGLSPATEDAALTAEIIAAHLALHGNPGVRRMWAHLTAVGRRISAKRVHRLMQAAGLQGRHSKQWKVTTVAGDNPAPAPRT